MADSRQDKELQEMLAKAAATLVRQKNRAIYRLPNGGIVFMSQTPDDWRARRSRIATLSSKLVLPEGARYISLSVGYGNSTTI